MANESEDFIIASPKRMRLDLDDEDSISSVESSPNSSEYTHCVDENSSRGGEMSTPVGSEDEKKTLLWIQNYETPDEDDMFMVIFNYLSEPPRRYPLPDVHSVDHVVKLIQESSKIMVLTGAGVSVSCGIPDFRSKDGVYARLAVDFPNLPDPQAMFDINFFRQDPRPFFKFAKEIYPGLFKPSPSHRFIKAIERHKKLLRNYTQNIDTLERAAGINNVIECHGSFATATCTVCCHKVSSDEIKETIFKQNIPYCPKCSSMATSEHEKGIMKPDIVFFGEGLPESFHDAMACDQDQCDLLIVIGSSLKVRPVALIPSSIPSKVPQVLINRERLPLNFDVELLGDSDVIIDHLCRKLGGEWTDVCWRETPLEDRTQPEMELYSSDSSDSSSSDEDDDIDTPDCEENKSLITDARDFRDGKEGTDSLLSDPREFQEGSGSECGAADNREIVDEPVKIKCQKIGKRHIGGSDDNSRHISLDSSRDSGIGENSNNSSDRSPSPTSTLPLSSPTFQTPTKPVLQVPKDLDNCFFCMRKRSYIFPGAEVPEIFYSSETTET